MLLRDQAHQYKEMYSHDQSGFVHSLFNRSFIRYIAPSIFMMALLACAFYTINTSYAAPQGFSSNIEQRSAPKGFGIEEPQPNTVKGVLHNAKTDDYVVLEGYFVATTTSKTVTYKFKDANGDLIDVDLSKSNNAVAPLIDVNYYLWGQVNQSLFSTSITAIEYTPII